MNESIIKHSEKLPSQIKLSLEKGKLLDKEWDDNIVLSKLIIKFKRLFFSLKIILSIFSFIK